MGILSRLREKNQSREKGEKAKARVESDRRIGRSQKIEAGQFKEKTRRKAIRKKRKDKRKAKRDEQREAAGKPKKKPRKSRKSQPEIIPTTIQRPVGSLFNNVITGNRS